jgi:hypothetical protein
MIGHLDGFSTAANACQIQTDSIPLVSMTALGDADASHCFQEVHSVELLATWCS